MSIVWYTALCKPLSLAGSNTIRLSCSYTLYITHKLLTIITEIFEEKNITKISILFLQRNIFPEGVWWNYDWLRLPLNASKKDSNASSLLDLN